MADLESGELRSTRDELERLLEALEPTAARLGAAEALRHARTLVAEGGAAAQRRAAGSAGASAAARWLVERFLTE